MPTILLSAVESEWHWQPVDRSFSLPIIPSGGIKELTSKFDLCVTGEVSRRLAQVTYPHLSCDCLASTFVTVSSYSLTALIGCDNIRVSGNCMVLYRTVLLSTFDFPKNQNRHKLILLLT